MTAQVETVNTLQPWRIGNAFAVTLRGHWQKIPTADTDPILASDYDPQAIVNEDFDPRIREVIGTTNYNTVYDSFYAPVDFKITGVTIRMPVPLPKNTQYDIKLKVNGGVLETVQIPEF